ncbi:cytochrome P450 [Streptomyces clavuligerus]|uniref:cytochrome P450 n=1 Tax=Streptomyces clavuligerus TaxID=1901 RepID=UPI00018004C8|nr:cytochrome P450 [Streptomyces clavuligerus]ANW18404.1 cytochrome [Streptomyces clavuligerus]AXU12959.1 cytochrome P450 [Streptomyces clavuligerus]EDY52541.1 NigD [Streptomyces clavuligerus]MBY6302887.1 cytochrome P450 [Streptomyces clavuligerus]QCS05743.1 cytochrome P450 [Streptomyces clavuligerus]
MNAPLSPTGTDLGAGTDLGDPAFWRLPRARRLAAFARLRALDTPVRFGPEPGFWALVRHADVQEASRDPRHFASAPGVTVPEPAAWAKAVFGDSMVNLDGAEHTSLRRIVSRAFTPRLLAATGENIRAVADRIVADAVRERPADFVASVASRMPFEVICDLMGVPERCRAPIAHRIDGASEHVGVARRRLRVPGRGLAALGGLQWLMARLARERRRRPTGDLISALVCADIDGQRLSSRQLGAFFSLLLVAGVETTRNALAHGLVLLTDHPGQRALLAEDFDRYADGAVEEIVRHSTPIIQFRRTVTAERALGGRVFRPGEKVVLLYASANRDERVFDQPDAFDITRAPNPHLGYGGGGPHHCLGAHLARQEMRALFSALLSRAPRVRATGAPRLVDSSFDNRVAALPFSLGSGSVPGSG